MGPGHLCFSCALAVYRYVFFPNSYVEALNAERSDDLEMGHLQKQLRINEVKTVVP